ncbi:MAG: hypothetical protein Ct9H90mP16_04780 [Candidatus Poseidoniales archaeon]|nr:MAG: hypothetical protein Ct9H90mP16_04780 [Candidatus Poseidoniales archaeon]
MQALTEELVQREEKDTSTELVVLDQKTPQLLSERERKGWFRDEEFNGSNPTIPWR